MLAEELTEEEWLLWLLLLLPEFVVTVGAVVSSEEMLAVPVGS